MWKIFKTLGFGKILPIEPILTPDKVKKIDAQKEKLNKFLRVHKNEFDKDQKEKVERTNNKCSNCGNTDKLQIVDKIAQVQGRGEVDGNVSGNLFSVSGYVYGKSETDTNAVNHCNKCGNQWKKITREYKWRSDIIADRLQQLIWYIEGVDNKKERNWWEGVYRSFSEYYLETMLWLVDEGWTGLSRSEREFLTKNTLKPYFKSIHTENENIS